MEDFTYRNCELYIEDCNLNSLADSYGTPCYIYSRAAITRCYQAYAEALGQRPGKICYAVKANSNLAVLQVLAQLGAGFDIVSIGELERVMMAGGRPEQIIFSGVGKSANEIQRALDVGIACFNIESEAELHTLAELAQQNRQRAKISIRVNPDVDANTHPYISTGLKENKFGVDIEQALDLYRTAQGYQSIQIAGVDCHIGSQLTRLAPFEDALERVLALIDSLEQHNIKVSHLDLGGGLGVSYQHETPPPIADYVACITRKLAHRDLTLWLEPGRSIVANAGVLLTSVIYLKPGTHKNFVIVDAAMNDNIRPALYAAWQDIRPVIRREGQSGKWDIVGPVCETADFLGKDRELVVSTGDRLAMMSSGAYGFVMSSNYNSRGRATEVLVDGNKHYLVRARETFADIVRGEQLLPTEALQE